MTPSDRLDGKQGSWPASVSSASSLDSMERSSRQAQHIPSSLLSQGNDTRQNENAAAPRGDEGSESQNASRSQHSEGVISPATSAVTPSVVQSSLASMMLPSNHLGIPVLPSGTPLTMPGTAGNNAIPEFLYQLTKMLTDNNRHTIEWTNGKIEVHSPHRLESEVLQKYFRHSKFASFQRQLNYFGFRKNAGKGKMAPCSYVNEATTNDISSILMIKRKTTASITAAKEKKKESTDNEPTAPQRKVSGDATNVNPVLAGILQSNSGTGNPEPHPAQSHASAEASNTLPARLDSSYRAVAKSAVGRGIRHSFLAGSLTSNPTAPTPGISTAYSESKGEASQSQDSLSQLAANYQSSLNNLQGQEERTDTTADQYHFDTDPTPLAQMQGDASTSSGFYNDEPSLLELAMIPEIDEGDGLESTNGFSFVDFPHPEVRPRASDDWDPNFQ